MRLGVVGVAVRRKNSMRERWPPTHVAGTIQLVTAHARKTSSKVPEITAYFWIIKILTTGMGETTSDYLIHRVGLTNTIGLVVVVFVSGLALGACLLVQVTAGGTRPPSTGSPL